MPGQVERWLETFMCKQYAETFEAYGFKTLQSLCQIQLQQLQIMGVAQEHCEQILDNVDILRQSILGGTSGINHYQDSMYNAYGNRPSNIGPMHHNSPAVPVPMNSIQRNMTGYNSQSYLNNQASMIQQQHQQTQYLGHNSMYSMSQHGAYLGYGGSAEPRQYQYSAVDRRGGNSYTSDIGPQRNPNGYHTRPQSQNVSNQQVPQTLMHPHMRHNSVNQNPQEVANNILQMAASTYMPNQTVTVPLSKNRSAPYHIPPKSPHNSYSMQGNCPSSTSQQQHMGQAHQFAYPNSSPHQASQRPCASPMSPNPAYLHSPTTSHHSGQSMPNSSPQSIHSPTYGMSGPCVKSPRSVAPSPGGEVCSPCQMASPISCQVNAPNASPHHQQLCVNVPSGNHSVYQGLITSPNQQNSLNQYSPKTNPVTPPASHNVSPYSNSSRSSLHSPQHKSSMPLSNISGQFFSDSASDIPEPNLSPQEKSNSNPLQSLQKLCMLPDHQVIDPKSVINDACLELTQSNEHPKNLNSDVDNQFQNQDQVSASKTNSPERCDNISDVKTKMAKTSNIICSDTLAISNDLSHESCSLDSSNRDLGHVESPDFSKVEFSDNSVESDKSKNVSNIKFIQSGEKSSLVKEETEQMLETKHHSDLQTCNISQQHEVEQLSDEAQNSKEIQEHFENQGQNETQGDKEVQQGDMTKEILVKDKENLLSSDAEDVTLDVKEISESGVHAYPNCGLLQCKTMINPETDGCEQVICKSVGCKENDDILSEIIDYENVAKENNNEIIPQLNGDENSCIQYYRPKCIKKTKRKKKLNINSSFHFNSKMFAKVRENPLLVKTYSRRDQLAAKYRWRRSQMPRSMSLRGVPARLASAAQYSSANYTDSDSDDGGVLLVREDIDFTQDQGSPLPLDNVSDEVSPEGDVSSANDTERDDIISLEENQSSPPSSVVEGEGSVQSVENINIHELALDTTKNSQTLAVDGAKNQAKVKSKSSQCAKKDDKSNLVEGLSRNSTNTQNGHIQSEQKNGKFESTSKSGRIRKSKNHSSAQNVKKDSDDDEKMVTKNKQSANKTPSRTPAKRSSRKRRTASSLKYGDLYYSADYVLDSEEEVEQKSKIERRENNSRSTKDCGKNEEANVIILNDDDNDDDSDDNKSKIDKDVAVLSAVEGSKRTKSKTNAKVTLEDVSVEDFSGTMTKNNCSELKQQKNSYIAKLVNEDGEVISISDDELGKEVKEKQKKSLLKDKKKLKSQNVKSGNKSGKGRLKKLQKSHAKFELLDDETEEINLRKAISIMNKKHKKPERVKLDENKSRITGPFLRVKTTEPCCCRVVNQYEEGSEMSDQKITKKVSTPITVSTVHMSKLSAEKSIHVPSNSLTETNWVCQLCHKHSSFKFLGDLFGPYFCEGNIPSSSPQDTPNSDLKKHKQKIVTNLDVGDLQQKTKKRTNLADLSRSEEVWVHEDCIAWADGVLLIGQKIYGLEEATAIASTTMCSACKENGAMVGCLHKGCSQKFHYICAVESGCFMDEENFSLLCIKHKDKKIKQIETSSKS